MVNLNQITIFKDHVDTLEKTSLNDDQNIYMTASQKIVINFDAVKTKYAKQLSLSDWPASIDALVQVGQNVYFIEFKDGNLKKEIYGLRRKIYESLLLYCDITKEQISDTRTYMTYILVYNKAANKSCIGDVVAVNSSDSLASDEVQDTPSVDKLILEMGELSNQTNTETFGLRVAFKGLYFLEVLVYDKEEFSDSLLV